MKDSEFQTLLGACSDLSRMFEPGLVFIGGIAVYMHAINSSQAREMAEATHDGDFYISMADMQDLRDIEEVVPNRRLNKAQIIKKGFEFDVYVERQASLIVPYADVAAHAVDYDGVRVASLEHLLVLKLEAFRDRQNSAKGDKDARDIFRIAAIADPASFDACICAPFLQDEHLALFSRLRTSSEAVSLADGNAVRAKQLRSSLKTMLDAVEQCFDDGGEHHDKLRPRPLP